MLLCCYSVAQSCPTLCNSRECSMPGFPVLHHLLEFTHTHVHRVSDAIQPSHPLSFPSRPALNLSQHQSLFQWVNSQHQSLFQGVGSSHQVAKVLELQLQHQSFQWKFRVYFLLEWLVWSPCHPRDSSTTVWKHQFFDIQSSFCPALTSIDDSW